MRVWSIRSSPLDWDGHRLGESADFGDGKRREKVDLASRSSGR